MAVMIQVVKEVGVEWEIVNRQGESLVETTALPKKDVTVLWDVEYGASTEGDPYLILKTGTVSVKIPFNDLQELMHESPWHH